VTQEGLLMIGMIVLGVYAVGWTRRLALPWSELPLKTTAATAAAVALVLAEVAGATVDPTLRLVAVVLVPLFVLAPLAVTAAARARAYPLADAITALVYWTAAGRAAVGRLTVQVALQRGDAEAALARIPEHEGEVMRAQALAAQGAWEAVLDVPLPAEGDGAFLAALARVEALVGLGRLAEADEETRRMRARWERGDKGPIGYRCLVLGEAMVDAERGNVRRVREALATPLPGVAPDVLFGVIARAAEVAGDREVATRLYAEAYRQAPEGRRARFERPLREWGEPLPQPARRAGARRATLALTGSLAALFAGQLALDAAVGTAIVGPYAVDASNVAAAFVLGLPLPDGDAWWRYLSYAFVHANVVHIGFNLWVLLDIGRLYEARRGGGNLVAAFTVGAAMGAYLTGVAQAGMTVVLVGASGGVLGVAGALLADVLRSTQPHDRALLRGLLQWMALIALISVAIPNVSLWGHVGGVVGGLLWGFVRQGLPGDTRLDAAAGVLAVAALALAFAQVVRVVLVLL
jgi:membrane associated rhomboid family serine protease